jgi:ubiquinone/menaquinone biosynthesis C-methylase UbiE
MKMDDRDVLIYSEELVQRLNELYHDITADQYDQAHPEIIQQKERLQRVAECYLRFIRPIVLLEIGTGTGFVPSTIAHILKDSDVFVCSDISSGILRLAEEAIRRRRFKVAFKFVKIARQVPYRVPFASSSVDVVLMNSVLHHVKDTTTFLSEVERVIKPGGLLLICHEPNKYFYDNLFLWCNYRACSWLTSPIKNLLSCLDRIPRNTTIGRFVRTVYYRLWPRSTEASSQKINTMLLCEQMTRRPLAPAEIGRIVDIRSREGFRPDALFPDFQLLLVETYNHISWVTVRHHDNAIIRGYDRILSREFPKSGSDFLVVLKKRDDDRDVMRRRETRTP